MIFVAECRYGPQEDIELLQTVADIVSNALIRKQNEEALKQSERNYREIFNAANDVILVHRISDGIILDANQRTLELMGYDYEEVLTLNINDISFGKSPYSQKEATQWTRKTLKNGPQLFDWLIKRKDGEFCWVEVHLKRATIQGKKRIISVMRDITKRKEFETERTNLVNELKATLKKVKTLSGLLPICSKCKKIRDDNGYWNQIENYIRDHSKADFSHSLCPDCVTEMYPGLKID